MIPIRLNWQRYTDGFQLQELRQSSGTKVKIAEPRSKRTDALLHEAINLEDPIVLRLVNCETDADYIKFLHRFGTLEEKDVSTSDEITGDIEFRYGSFGDPRSGGYLHPAADASNKSPITLNMLRDRALSLHGLIKETLWTGRVDTGSKVRFLNELMDKAKVVVRPCFVHTADKMQFVLQADTLFAFMVMEITAAHEAEAVATSCERCRKVFLTGPLTGRRSHAKYCSDRCRVAAMRTRNAAKGK
ncbi:hypothetical protein [Rhizobium hidalgonense]|uniref:Zinc finger CGNR domain-containing protein n=1 Tax=Rhizobium hidalgonense TaxID=1538159 RepID=A0ABX4JXE9_9HYPH|nr:hypothetical protein [Rhizobium hidalgonense]PDT24805.1 hypothetical protein CO674_05565 [Rhizobium hidalgonense]PON05403.1 hypothetical protein ATY29_22875 [Rhizobium hidalgonense]